MFLYPNQKTVILEAVEELLADVMQGVKVHNHEVNGRGFAHIYCELSSEQVEAGKEDEIAELLPDAKVSIEASLWNMRDEVVGYDVWIDYDGTQFLS